MLCGAIHSRQMQKSKIPIFKCEYPDFQINAIPLRRWRTQIWIFRITLQMSLGKTSFKGDTQFSLSALQDRKNSSPLSVNFFPLPFRDPTVRWGGRGVPPLSVKKNPLKIGPETKFSRNLHEIFTMFEYQKVEYQKVEYRKVKYQKVQHRKIEIQKSRINKVSDATYISDAVLASQSNAL